MQVYLQRILAIPYMETQSYMGIFYGVRLAFGLTFTIGVIAYVVDFFSINKRKSTV